MNTLNELLPHYKSMYHAAEVILENAEAITKSLSEEDIKKMNRLIENKEKDALDFVSYINGLTAFSNKYKNIMNGCGINVQEG